VGGASNAAIRGAGQSFGVQLGREALSGAVEGAAGGLVEGGYAGWQAGGLSGMVSGAATGAVYGAGIGAATAGAFKLSGPALRLAGRGLMAAGRGVATTSDTLIDVLDTFAPRLNPLNYRLRSAGMYSGIGGLPLPNISFVAPQGGTYLLVAKSGAVVRTGRTGNLLRRRAEHARMYEGLEFIPALETNSYAVQRGHEQILHELHQPILNKIRPIRENHPKRLDYLKAWDQAWQGQT